MQRFSSRASVPTCTSFLNVFRNLSRFGYVRIPAVVGECEFHDWSDDCGGQRLSCRVANTQIVRRDEVEDIRP